MPLEATIVSRFPGRPPGRRLRRPTLALLLVAVVASTGCGEPAPPGDVTAERADRRVLELALEVRRLHEETVEAGTLLVEGSGDETGAATSLRVLSRDARELAARIRAHVPVLPETASLREAAEQVERGAERLLTFRRFEEPNVLLAGSDALEEADRELDAVARWLDARLDESAQRELDALRRDVPEIAAAEPATHDHGRTPAGLRHESVSAMT